MKSHTYAQHDTPACTVCGGEDLELATECPGRRMTSHERQGVSLGRLDFISGAWVAKTVTLALCASLGLS